MAPCRVVCCPLLFWALGCLFCWTGGPFSWPRCLAFGLFGRLRISRCYLLMLSSGATYFRAFEWFLVAAAWVCAVPCGVCCAVCVFRSLSLSLSLSLASPVLLPVPASPWGGSAHPYCDGACNTSSTHKPWSWPIHGLRLVMACSSGLGDGGRRRGGAVGLLLYRYIYRIYRYIYIYM